MVFAGSLSERPRSGDLGRRHRLRDGNAHGMEGGFRQASEGLRFDTGDTIMRRSGWLRGARLDGITAAGRGSRMPGTHWFTYETISAFGYWLEAENLSSFRRWRNIGWSR
jgi:hypothetical protein